MFRLEKSSEELPKPEGLSIKILDKLRQLKREQECNTSNWTANELEALRISDAWLPPVSTNIGVCIAELKESINCIYVLRHPSGKPYVGQAQVLRKRITKHIRDLKNGTHRNKHLQNVYNKEGWVFSIEVVEEDILLEQLTCREQYWIDTLDSANPDIGYNLSKVADGPPMSGRKHSKESKRKMADSMEGKGMTGKHHSTASKKRSSNTHKLRFLRGYERTAQSLRCLRKPKPNARGKKKPWLSEKRSKDFVAISPEGVEYRGKGLKQFCLKHGLDVGAMSSIACGLKYHKHHKGWSCYYV